MKPSTFLIGLLIGLCLGMPAFAQQSWDELEYPPLNEIELPNVERVQLRNRLTLFLIEDDELPVINLSARIGTGSIHEPADKVGLAQLTGTVMRTGGTTNRSGDEIDLALESIGASVETSIGQSVGTASMSVLKDDIDTGLAILADLLQNPAFPEDKIEQAKVQFRTVISRQNDNAQQVAFREFDELIYGEDSPYAREPEYATLDNITRDDLVAFHAEYYHPNNTMIGIWGDFDMKEMVAKVREHFDDWPRMRRFKRPEAPEIDYSYDSSVDLVNKEDVNQSVILMGHLGGQRDNPDYFALQVMNSILGGGFASRLFSRVRSDQGLAYAVFGTYGANYDRPGQFYAGVMSKSESTVEAAEAVKREIENMRTEPVTEEELNLAKESFLNSFVFNFDTRSEVVNRMMTYEYYDYPKDFLQKTKSEIEEVTTEDVQRVAQEYLKPDQMRMLVVGKASDFDQPLSTLGTVNERDITIPMPVQDMPEATDEALASGQTKLDAVIEAAGGKEAFASVENIYVTGTQTVPQMGNQTLEFTLTLEMSGRMAIEVSTPMGAVKQTYREGEAFMEMGPQSGPAPPEVKDQLESSMWQNFTYLFANADQVEVQDLGTEDIDGASYEVLRITPPTGTPFSLYLTSDTMLPARLSTQVGPNAVEQTYSDFREVEGRSLPFQSETTIAGQAGPQTSVSEVQFNVDVDEGLFDTGSQ